MHVVVTGSGGLVGRQVCEALLERGHEVTGMVRRTRAVPDGVRVVRGDLRTPSTLAKAFETAEVVVHCAAVYSYLESPTELHRIAVEGTRAALTAAAAAGVRRMVVTSSSVTCGSSAGPEAVDETHRPGREYAPEYFVAKQAQERVALELGDQMGIEVVVACPTVVLGGPAPRLVPSNAVLLRYLMDPTRTTYAGGCNVVGARDVGLGHALLAEAGEPGQRYLLGGHNLTWRALHSLLSELAGVPGPYLTSDAATAALAARAAGLWGRVTSQPAFVTEDEARTVGRYYWYRHDRVAALGYVPAPARAVVAEALAWLLVSEDLPRWVREGLYPLPEVRGSRRLVPRPLR